MVAARKKGSAEKAAAKKAVKKSTTSRRTKVAKKAQSKQPATKRTERDSAVDDSQLRLLVRTRTNELPTTVSKLLAESAGRAVRVTPLYGSSKSRPYTEFLARLTLSKKSELDNGFAFDLAHRAREGSQGRFIWVEPDIIQKPSVSFADLDDAPRDNAAEVGGLGDIASGLCTEQAVPPADHYWHLREMRVPQAWAFSETNGEAARGAGVRIGHLDTGWTKHPELFPALDLNGQIDFVDDDAEAKDELAKGNPFHGSRTGSVIASTFEGDLPTKVTPFAGKLAGVAPNAKLVPIRVVKSVVVFFNGDVARGIRHAADNDCHVISMSLGGVGGNSLHDAVKHAVAQNVIVCAAAGNCVRMVVWPARYAETIAVAATNSNNRPWKGSSRGEAVDITAPGAQVWTAAKPTTEDPGAISQGEGTSFAVAGIAGIAALWLAHHGRERLIAIYNARDLPLQFVFRHVIRNCVREIGLPKGQFGAGFIDASAVLNFALPQAELAAAEMANAIGRINSFDSVNANLLGSAPSLVRDLAMSNLTSTHDAAERDLLMQEFAQICFDHPNAQAAYGRGLELASAGALMGGSDVSHLLNADGIAKYASGRLRSKLMTR